MIIDYENRADLFWMHVDRSGGDDSCWNWQRCATKAGYGQLRWKSKAYYAHRFAWFLTFGSWPSSETLDHVCRNRRCVNPRHLREASRAANVLCGISPPANNARSAVCVKGHQMVGENIVRMGPDHRWRRCRECKRDRERAAHARRRRAQAA